MKRMVIVIFLIAVVCSLFFGLFLSERSDINHSSDLKAKEQESFISVRNTHAQSSEINTTTDNSDLSTSIQPYKPRHSQQDIEDIRQYFENSVSHDRDGKVYTHYSEQILIDLAEQGDLQAIKELAYRYATEGPSLIEGSGGDITNQNIINSQFWHDQTKKYLTKAIVYGDRELLEKAAIFLADPVDYSDPESIRKATLKKLSFWEFASMRGNHMNKYYGAVNEINVYEGLFGKLNLTAEDKDFIYKNAKKIYDSFEQERINLGLGPFDNSVPNHLLDTTSKDGEEYKLYIDKLGGNAF